jgi:hypothetical protein
LKALGFSSIDFYIYVTKRQLSLTFCIYGCLPMCVRGSEKKTHLLVRQQHQKLRNRLNCGCGEHQIVKVGVLSGPSVQQQRKTRIDARQHVIITADHDLDLELQTAD